VVGAEDRETQAQALAISLVGGLVNLKGQVPKITGKGGASSLLASGAVVWKGADAGEGEAVGVACSPVQARITDALIIINVQKSPAVIGGYEANGDIRGVDIKVITIGDVVGVEVGAPRLVFVKVEGGILSKDLGIVTGRDIENKGGMADIDIGVDDTLD
jgi:hypothetical protein